jgi:hypothetical protein
MAKRIMLTSHAKSRSTRPAKRSKKMPAATAGVNFKPELAEPVGTEAAHVEEPIELAIAVPTIETAVEPEVVAQVTKVIATKGLGKSQAQRLGEKVAFWLTEMQKAHAAGQPYVKSEAAYRYPARAARKAFHVAAIELDQQAAS